MTAQEIFDKVAAHLRKQGHAALRPIKTVDSEDRVVDGLGCAYRAPNGDMCAAGCIIPDELYRPEMEGKSINTLILENYTLSYLQEHSDLLLRLQRAHDDQLKELGIEAWERTLQSIARTLNLTYTSP